MTSPGETVIRYCISVSDSCDTSVPETNVRVSSDHETVEVVFEMSYNLSDQENYRASNIG